MLNKFIERPVLSTVISVLLLIFGILGLNILPVTQYPDIAPPTVQVTASYPGASAETILENVISPIEEKINGVDGMKYITSTATNNGTAEIQVFFDQEYDPDIAAVNVQNRVALANAVLPSDVIRAGISTKKIQNSALMYTSIYSTVPEYNELFLENYLKINVVPVLQRIKGVGEVNVYGGEYSMRVWIDPVKLANYNLTPADINRAIHEQSLEAAPGSFGQNAGSAFEFKIKYKGRLKKAEEYKNIILRSGNDGSLLRLKDVAKVELDAFSYSTKANLNGNPSATFGVLQTPGSNAREINKEIVKKFEEIQKDLPKGVFIATNYDTSAFLEASISKVVTTLLEAFFLVFLVVFIFLQDIRSTIIPAIAVPVSIVGTFFFLNLFGFSINLLTLFALILAIGIVVDDAIVVVEAVHTKLERGNKDVLSETKSAMGEISSAIISITLVMAAVFVPITFMQGPAGVFYRQFGLTLIVAILISAVNALTLSPALCALLIKPNHTKKSSYLQRFYTSFNVAFEKTTSSYTNAVKMLIKRKWITAAILILAVGALLVSNNFIPSGFVPNEDRGVIFVNIDLPPGSSLDRTVGVTNKLTGMVQEVEGVENVTLINGMNFFNGAGSSYAMGFIKLADWENRNSENTTIESITGTLYYLGSQIKDANIIYFTPPSVPGFGSVDGFEVQLLDKNAGSFEEFNSVAQSFVGQLFGRKEIMFASNSFNIDFPQYELSIDVPKAKRANINVDEILLTMQGYFGGIYSTDFSRFGKPYKVFIQAEPNNRKKIDDLSKIFVRNMQGEMAPVESFIDLKKINGPQAIKRFNLSNSITVSGSANFGYSTGDAIQAIREVAETLPENYTIEFSGITKEEIGSAGQAPVIIGLSILFVFFLLAAQYESYLLPFAVIFSLPVGVAGAFGFTLLTGQQNNIYFQIALVMLLGLLAKNAILIVEFARQRREQGMSLFDAAVDGAKERLRPILMTSFAFIMGLLPLAFATGVGARGNNSIGTGAAGGMLVGTLLGLFVIPVLYVVFQWLQEKVSSGKNLN